MVSDYSLVPVDYQPDFENVSLVPVDYNPFSEDGITQEAQVQQGQTLAQPIDQPQQPTAGVARLYVGPPAKNPREAEAGESWSPDTEDSSTPGPSRSTPPTFAQDNPVYASPQFNQPFGELKPWTPKPTERIGYLAADGLTALGMKPYAANDWATRLGNLLSLFPPIGVAGSALDFMDAKRRDDLSGALIAAAGMIPGAKGARGVITSAFHRHHPWPMYLGGAVKQELVALPKSLHIEFHRGLDGRLSRQRGTVFYTNQSPEERQKTLQKLAAYIRDFDAQHGTKLYDALLRNGFPVP